MIFRTSRLVGYVFSFPGGSFSFPFPKKSPKTMGWRKWSWSRWFSSKDQIWLDHGFFSLRFGGPFSGLVDSNGPFKRHQKVIWFGWFIYLRDWSFEPTIFYLGIWKVLFHTQGPTRELLIRKGHQYRRMVETDATLRGKIVDLFFSNSGIFLRRIDASTFLERFVFVKDFCWKTKGAATERFNLSEEKGLQNLAQDTKTTFFWIRVDFEKFWADEILVEISKGLTPDESQVLDGWTIFFVKKESVHPGKLAWIPKTMFFFFYFSFQYGYFNMHGYPKLAWMVWKRWLLFIWPFLVVCCISRV